MSFDKTILQVIPALDAGGAERTTVEMAQAIVREGGRALVATSGGRLAAAIEQAGGRVFLLPAASKNPATIFFNRLRLRQIIENEGVDLVHARSRAPAWSALMAARAAGVPIVTTYHGAYEATSRLKRFYNSSMVRGDLVIANSEFTAASIRRAYPNVSQIAVIPRGADISEFNPSGISPGRVSVLREKWELVENPGAMTLLLPGRLTAWKGHEIAIEAALKLRGGAGVFPPFRLVFAGDRQGRGAFAESLSRRVSELGLQEVIRIVGHCEDMPAAYSLADIVLSPSVRPEAFGRVAVEAGAMEKIVIASDHGGARETIIDGETGYLVAPNSSEALAEAIARAANLSDADRRATGACARERAIRRFSIDAMTRATINEYEMLLSTKSAFQ